MQKLDALLGVFKKAKEDGKKFSFIKEKRIIFGTKKKDV